MRFNPIAGMRIQRQRQVQGQRPENNCGTSWNPGAERASGPMVWGHRGGAQAGLGQGINRETLWEQLGRRAKRGNRKGRTFRGREHIRVERAGEAKGPMGEVELASISIMKQGILGASLFRHPNLQRNFSPLVSTLEEPDWPVRLSFPSYVLFCE